MLKLVTGISAEQKFSTLGVIVAHGTSRDARGLVGVEDTGDAKETGERRDQGRRRGRN